MRRTTRWSRAAAPAEGSGARRGAPLAAIAFTAVLAGSVAATRTARAQESEPPPLPPPGPGAPAAQPPPQYGPYPQQPGYGQGGYSNAPPGSAQPYAAPPPVEYVPPEPPPHAPKYSLYAGGRLSYVGFGGSFFSIDGYTSETTGNLVKQGPAIEFDVGARLGRRYIPFVFVEHGFLGTGHRFDGADASASTDLYGVGLRSISGDVDTVGLVTEITIGKRSVSVSSAGSTYTMSTIEFLKFGLGAEIRLSTLFTLSPLVSIAAGQMTDTNGDVQYANGERPTYRLGQQIGFSATYVVVGLGVGAHFDFFGK